MATDDTDRDRRRVLTVANAVTALRLAGVPVFVWLLFGEDQRFWAAFLLGVLGATDWLDGYLARRMGQVSDLGTALDPIADRLVIVTGVVAILVDGAAPLWVGAAVLAREAVVSVAVIVLAWRGAERIDVVWVGKAGTLGVMFAFPLFLAGHSAVSWHQIPEVAAWIFVVPGMALSWYAAAVYVPLARGALAESRLGSRS